MPALPSHSRSIPGAALLALLAAACAGDAGPPPSVVLVIIDTLRADRLGCYGYSRPTSPCLDRFAQESVLFENACSQAPNTPPSVASILTSLYPSTHGFTGMDDRVPAEAWTLAERFHAAGYRTGAFVDMGYLRGEFGFDQGFEEYDDQGGGFEAILPKATAWMNEVQAGGQPFFLMLHTYDVHTPYEESPEPYRSAFLSTVPASGLRSEQLESIRSGAMERTPTPEEIQYFSDLYDGGIQHADALLGEFLDELRAGGQLQAMVVAITSDHGEEFMEHGSVLHEKLYRTVTHVPLLVRMPVGRGRRVSQIVESLDIAPTLLAAAGLPHPGMQGRSLEPLLKGRRLDDHQALSQLPWPPEWDKARPHTVGGESTACAPCSLGFYEETYHLLLNTQTDEFELYDFERDPLEQRDLAAEEVDVAAKLKAELARRVHVAAQRATLRQDGDASGLDPETEASLKSLGYAR